MQSVSIRYSTSVSRTLVRILKVGAIVWCVIPVLWIFACLGPLLSEFVRAMPTDHALWAIQQALMTFASQVIAPVATILAGCLLLLIFLDDRIIVSRQGLVLPLSLCVQFYCHRNRLWSELKKSVLIKRNGRNVCLKLNFNDGNFVVFEADEMSEDDLNKLLIASRTLAPADEREKDDLNTLEHPGQQIPLDISTFTSLWESELTLRFRATTYVPLVPGRVLNTGIIVVKAISYGGSSAIYLARRQNGTPVVLKEFVVADSLDAEARSKALVMFKKEAVLLSKLKHKDIAKIYDHFVEDGRHYMTLQYIQGEDLRRLVARRGPISEKRVCQWMRQILAVLKYLEQQSPPVVHRDLTPENIVFRPKGNLAVIDFGAANEFIGTATGTVVGKQGYISPEQFRGKAELKSDIYSLGCTAHFLLTGKEPEALMQSCPKNFNKQVTDNINDLIMQMTCQKAEDRPTAEQALKTIETVGLYRESVV
jgi:tRNA A-37 threonylcarbamoyl transferase component Bud32